MMAIHFARELTCDTTPTLLASSSYDPALALILHVNRGRLRHVAPEVSIDHSQREIDSRRQTARSRDLLLFDEAQPAFYCDIGKRLGKPIEKVVMCRRRLAFQQSRLAELKCAGANRHYDVSGRRNLPQPRVQRLRPARSEEHTSELQSQSNLV